MALPHPLALGAGRNEFDAHSARSAASPDGAGRPGMSGPKIMRGRRRAVTGLDPGASVVCDEAW
ncbi:hypothetical protein AB4099_10335 [Bosea sp. 2KB_26]|uniref:hypothetical protein n=1 Tax=Bosea sp. 2KB_26 TaxID=3237475 RepID=UPI000DE46BFC